MSDSGSSVLKNLRLSQRVKVLPHYLHVGGLRLLFEGGEGTVVAFRGERIGYTTEFHIEVCVQLDDSGAWTWFDLSLVEPIEEVGAH